MSLICALILPSVLNILLSLVLRSDAYAMDQGQHRGSFFPLLIMYNVFGYVVSIAALAIAAFAYQASQWSSAVLVIAAVEALLFNIWLTFSYESYLHATAANGTSNYSRWKYAATLSLGLSAIITFVMGLAMAVVAIGAGKVG